ncbi:MAG TPA: calcium-binding protein [Actinomycetota bacterium]
MRSRYLPYAVASALVVVVVPNLPATAAAPTRCAGVVATIVGTAGPDAIVGTAGRDVIAAGDGEDSVSGRGGGDLVCGGGGFDRISGGPGDDRLVGGGADDTLLGRRGDDVLEGGVGIDALFAGPGDDRLVGGPNRGLGIEGLIPGPGRDRLVGGGGLDAAHYFDARRGVRVDLAAGTARGEGRDVLDGVEGAVGSNHDDVLLGDARGNGLFGQRGDDTIRGRGSGDLASLAFDVLAGDGGADVVDGGAGTDMASFDRIPVPVTVDLAAGTATGQGHDDLVDVEGAIGSVLDDVIVGDAGDNAFAAGLGADSVDGAGGVDTAILADLAGPVTVDLAAGVATSAEATDTIASIEAVWGTSASDTLLGDDGPNALLGFRGDDGLVGRAGDDLLVGGAGSDTADGGDGTDACVGVEDATACETGARGVRGRGGVALGWLATRRGP